MKSYRSFLVFIGNILYHFDRALFNLLIPFLAPLFFPTVDPIYALISMFIISPLTLLTKPLGALVFGYFGDKLGRKKVLSITLMGMSIKTGLMGFLPTYHEIGIFAPLILVFTRLALGFFSAGETTGGAIYLLEKSSENQRNFVSSLFDASGILGIFLASFSIGRMHSYENFWRILFWIGGIIGVVGWFFRKLPEDENVRAEKPMYPWKILWQYKSSVLAVAILAGFSYANYYLITHFMNGFLPLISSITKVEAISLNSTLLGIDFLLLPLFGLLSIKMRKEVLIFSSILGIISCCMPLFFLLYDVTFFKAACVRIVLTIFGVALASVYHAWVFEITPSNHRYLVGAFGTVIGSQLFGSPMPAFSLWLYKQTGLIIAPTFPVVLLGVFSLIILFKTRIIIEAKAKF